jgi:hypothetical protein
VPHFAAAAAWVGSTSSAVMAASCRVVNFLGALISTHFRSSAVSEGRGSVALTIATIPPRTASGSPSHRRMMSAKVGAFSAKNAK